MTVTICVNLCYDLSMIEITPTLSIDDSEIQLDYIRASGPGGQNVNKVSTAVQLRFDVRGSPSLVDDVKQRLIRLAGKRVTDEGMLLIDAKRYRTQEQNRADAILRLTALIQRALERPKSRRATRPSLAAQTRRLESKKKRGDVKKMRGSAAKNWE